MYPPDYRLLLYEKSIFLANTVFFPKPAILYYIKGVFVRTIASSIVVLLDFCATVLGIESRAVLSDSSELTAEIGVANTWKPGVWIPISVNTPVSVNLDKKSSDLGKKSSDSEVPVAVICVDDDGFQTEYPLFDTIITEKSVKTVGLFRTSRQSPKISVRLAKKSSDSSAKFRTLDFDLPTCAGSHREVFLVIGTEAEADFVRQAVSRSDLEKDLRPLVIRLDCLEQLPTSDFKSLQVVDRVIWFHKPGQSTQSSVLYSWLRQGGDLTIASEDSQFNSDGLIQSTSNQSTSNQSDSNQAALTEREDSTGRTDSTESPKSDLTAQTPSEIWLSQTTSIEEFANSEVPLPRLGVGRKYSLKAAKTSVSPDAVVLCRFMDIPLIFRQAVGFGCLTRVAFDLSAKQIQQWSNKDRFLRRILDIPETVKDTQRFTANSILHFGYDDMPGQLASALNQYTDIPCVSFWSIAGLLLIFIAIIGAGEYFLWNRFNLPSRLTWITFPVCIALFCGLFYWISLSNKSPEIRANLVSVLDFDCQNKFSRGYFYGDVYVPQAEKYDLWFDCPYAVTDKSANTAGLEGGKKGEEFEKPGKSDNSEISRNTWIGWFGSTGQGLSGMNSSTRLYAGISNCYQIDSRIHQIPIAAGSTRNLAGGFSNESPQNYRQPELSCSLSDDLGKPIGKIVNKTTDQVWEECLLLYDNWAFPLGELKPGQEVQINDSLQRYSLDAALVGKRISLTDISEKYSNQAVPYNPSELNSEDILRTMMFYKASGGVAYTKLDNGYQAPADFSRLIKLHRAVLLCRVPKEQAEKAVSLHISPSCCPNAPIEARQTDQRLTFYRFVLPVK